MTESYELRHEKTCPEFPTRSDINRAVQPQKRLEMKSDYTIYVAKTKVPISCAVTAQLISVFVFAYANAGFLMTRRSFFLL